MKFKYILTSIVCLFIISVILSFTSLTLLESLRISFGSLFVLFLPGFIISYIFFRKGKIDIIERIALSFALSIAIVPLVVFYLNLIGLKINTLNSFITISAIIIISLVILKIKRKKYYI